jgi:hypothetical protein
METFMWEDRLKKISCSNQNLETLHGYKKPDKMLNMLVNKYSLEDYCILF